jgi:HPt (histidine-containing phosphotransfer) domain-containing protein
MARIERSLSGDAASLPADLAYEEVRHSFLARLRSERTTLTALTLALRSPAPTTLPAFHDLGEFAHRLRGAAAVFDFRALRDCAKNLEVAANAAARSGAPAGEPRVQEAMRELQVLLTGLMGTAAS